MSLAEAAPSRPRSAAALQSRERQIDRAWREHEPERAMVPAEARRAVRAFKTTVASSDARFRSVFRSTAFRKLLQELLNAWCRRGALRAERLRAANRIKAALVPEAQFGEAAMIDADAAEILLFWPSAHDGFFKIARPTFEQPGIVIAAARFVRAVGRGRVWVFPVLEIPDQALGRMYQRSPGIDAVAALNEAARAFLAADYRDVEAARLSGATLHLPCGPGLLLCQAFQGEDLEMKTRLIARANTFVAAAQAGPDQRPLAPAADPSKSVLAAAVGSSATPPAACGASRSEGPGAASRVRFD